MTPLGYLLLGFVVSMALGGLLLWKGMRRAAEGYENDRGFHRGALSPMKFTPPASAPVPAYAFRSVTAFPSVTGTATSGLPMSASVANLLTTVVAPVTTPVKGPDAIPSPLYRRHRRSTNSHPPMPIASASPFEIQCAATRQRAGQTVDSTPPVDVSAKALIKDILGQKSVR